MRRQYFSDIAGVPAPTSPISHAVVVGDTCWISGQHALSLDGTYCPGSALEEASRCFELIFHIAKAAGFTRTDIVFVDIAFRDLADLPPVNTLFESLFVPAVRPARTIYQAARLPFGARIKVQAVAAR